FACEDTFESKIGHGSGDDAIARESVLASQIARDCEKNGIAVDDSSVGRNEQGAIGVTIEGHAECGAFGGNAPLQVLEMKRTATGVDVPAVGFRADRNNIRTKRSKQFRGQLVGGAIGAIENNAKTLQRRAGDEATAEKRQILMVERTVGFESRQSEGQFLR